jgi:hypothetical protein
MEIFEEKVFKYRTADGKVFDTEVEATKHETELKTSVKLFTLPNGKVLGKHDIKQFFRQSNCMECPFIVECHDMQDEIRKHTTRAFSLCDVIAFSD